MKDQNRAFAQVKQSNAFLSELGTVLARTTMP
jgi:hypothetical protein